MIFAAIWRWFAKPDPNDEVDSGFPIEDSESIPFGTISPDEATQQLAIKRIPQETDWGPLFDRRGTGRKD